MPGKDGIVKAVRFRAGRNHFKKPILTAPLPARAELRHNTVEENTKTKLNPETPAFRR